MLYKQFQNLQLSELGFGAMRLPLLPDGSGTIDQAELDRMVDAAMEAGVNYYDTAHPYHDGKSEGAIGRSLARYPRETWHLADKFPGHQNVHGVKELQPAEVFEEQLQRCGVEYFDFYLLHNVNEQSMAYYCNPEKHCLDYFLEQKAKGRIRHLGFSCHAGPEALQEFVDGYGKDLEFCQIQLNYVDWKLQNAQKKVEILRKAGLPIWVMEPVRGGKLASFAEETEAEMHALRPDESCAAWAFRWLQSVPKPTMVLSGMSNLQQMEDNLKTFSAEKPLNAAELAVLEKIAADMQGKIPCTGCRYCCAGCPVGLNIPMILSMANELQVSSSMNLMMRYSALGDGKRAADCIACGQCREACPQKIDVPAEMAKFAEAISTQKTWEEICRERAAAAAKA
ncbi:MAG: aldo/keto reductase [Oscillospiraceae bacterium]|nr:aldo/keto reductase [Oscillospiraceae bacterium]